MKKLGGALVAVIVVALVWFGITWVQRDDTSSTAIPSGLTNVPSVVVETSAAPTELETAVPVGCPANPGPMTNPVSVELVGHAITMPMLSLGLSAEGAAEAPPGDASHTVAWYNEGPALGSDAGKALLTAHTYQQGGAIGNELNGGLLSVGDVLKFVDASGAVACYRYTSNLRILEAEYDPDSDIVYDYDGDPEFALVVCSDYDSSGVPLGRMIYYGTLITGEAEAASANGTP